MERIWIRTPLGFRLQALADYYARFVPSAGMATSTPDGLRLAFRLDGSFQPVLVTLREQGNHLQAEVVGTEDTRAVERQLARMFGFDAQSEAWFELAERDAVVGELQRAFPGFLSAASPSPYDAAVWAVLSPRMQQRQAARIQLALARELGETLDCAGTPLHFFPSPRALSSLERFPGLTPEKVARLRGVGEAAARGLLDPERLHALGEERALRELRSLRGVGAWAASHIYFRGVAPRDGLPTAEPRLLHGFSSAYRLRTTSLQVFQRVASSWRPFRLWVCVLLMRHLGDLTFPDRAPLWRPRAGVVSNPSSP